MVEEFPIVVMIQPDPQGRDQVKRDLEFLQREAREAQSELKDIASIRDRGTQATLNRIAETLERTEERAIVTDARISQIGRDIQPRGVQRLRSEVRRTETQVESLNRAFQRVNRVINFGVAGFTTAFLVRGLAELSDEATNLSNRLRVVTRSEADLANVQQRLLEISNATRSSFEGSVTIFQRLAVNQESLGVSTERILKFTERLNQAIAISGLTANEARNGIIQLSQGLASGALRGDELRSVLEQLPPVANLIADRLGVSVGALRTLGAQGKITSEIIISALADADDVAKQFANSVPTISQAVTVLGNQAVELAGGFNDATGAAQGFAKAIISLAENLQSVVTTAAVLGGPVLLQLGANYAKAAIAARNLRIATAAAEGASAAAQITAGGLTKSIVGFGLAAAAAGAAVSIFSGRLQKLNEDLNAIKRAQEETEAEFAATPETIIFLQQRQRELNNINRLLEQQKQRGFEASEDLLKARARLQQQIAELRGEFKKELDDQKANEDAAKANSAAIREQIAELEEQRRLLGLSSEEQRIQEEIARRTEELKKKDVDLSSAQLAAKKEEIESLVRGNAEAEREREVLERIKGPTQQRQKDLELLKKLLDEGRISQEEFNKAQMEAEGGGIGRRQRAQEDPFEKQLRTIKEENEELMVMNSLSGEEETLQLAILALKRQKRDATASEVEQLKQAIELNRQLTAEAKKQAEEERNKMREMARQERMTERENQRIENVAAEINGTRGLAQAVDDVTAARQRGLITIEQEQSALDELRLRQLETSTGFADGFERAFLRIRQEAENLSVIGDAIVTTFADRATDAVIEFARTGEFEFKKFANAVLEELLQILIRLIIIKTISAVGGGIGSLLGSSIGGAALTSSRQGGGTVQPGQNVLVGEAGPEVIRVGQTGSVVPNQQPVVVQAPPVNIVNVMDPEEIRAQIDSGNLDGPILNVIARNPSQTKSAQAI